MDNFIDIIDIARLLDVYHQNYEFVGDQKSIDLFDKGDSSRTRITISDDNKYVSYEGRVIGGLKELERML